MVNFLYVIGGDQAFYYYNIEGTLLQDALNYLANVKKVVIGGTSAGCAIQGFLLQIFKFSL